MQHLWLASGLFASVAVFAAATAQGQEPAPKTASSVSSVHLTQAAPPPAAPACTPRPAASSAGGRTTGPPSRAGVQVQVTCESHVAPPTTLALANASVASSSTATAAPPSPQPLPPACAASCAKADERNADLPTYRLFLLVAVALCVGFLALRLCQGGIDFVKHGLGLAEPKADRADQAEQGEKAQKTDQADKSPVAASTDLRIHRVQRFGGEGGGWILPARLLQLLAGLGMILAGTVLAYSLLSAALSPPEAPGSPAGTPQRQPSTPGK